MTSLSVIARDSDPAALPAGRLLRQNAAAIGADLGADRVVRAPPAARRLLEDLRDAPRARRHQERLVVHTATCFSWFSRYMYFKQESTLLSN